MGTNINKIVIKFADNETTISGMYSINTRVLVPLDGKIVGGFIVGYSQEYSGDIFILSYLVEVEDKVITFLEEDVLSTYKVTKKVSALEEKSMLVNILLPSIYREGDTVLYVDNNQFKMGEIVKVEAVIKNNKVVPKYYVSDGASTPANILYLNDILPASVVNKS